MGNRSDGGFHCAPPFGGTVFIFLVLVVTSACLLGGLGQRQMPSASSLVQGRASKSFPTEVRERRVGSLHQTAKNGVFSLRWRPLPHPPNSICHYICQSGLKSPLRQGAWEEQSTTWISNTECTHLRTEPLQYTGGSPAASPGHDSHRAPEGTDCSSTESKMQTFGTTGRSNVFKRHAERCPLSTTQKSS